MKEKENLSPFLQLKPELEDNENRQEIRVETEVHEMQVKEHHPSEMQAGEDHPHELANGAVEYDRGEERSQANLQELEVEEPSHELV